MNENLLRVYHALPPWTRSLVATGRGMYLGFWRYNRQTDRMVEQDFEREEWDAKRWKSWQEERLAFVLDRAATKVPYYRALWERRRRAGDRASWHYLENWGILEKGFLRSNPEAFVADDCRTKGMFAEHTSGSTAKPITLWRSRKVQRAWYALLEARTRYWYRVTRHDRWGILGGQLIVPVTHREPPFWLWNHALHQLYMSSYHLAPDLAPYYLDAIKKYEVKYLLGYSSALYFLAQQAMRLGRRDVKLTVAITNAEPLSQLQRRVISEAFECPVRETYGSAEIVGAASECEHGQMHLWPEVGYLEQLDAGAMEDAIPGELLCTGLLNTDMPLIRYRLGDCANLETEVGKCSCGRMLPRMTGLEGRAGEGRCTAGGGAGGRRETSLP